MGLLYDLLLLLLMMQRERVSQATAAASAVVVAAVVGQMKVDSSRVEGVGVESVGGYGGERREDRRRGLQLGEHGERRVFAGRKRAGRHRRRVHVLRDHAYLLTRIYWCGAGE